MGKAMGVGENPNEGGFRELLHLSVPLMLTMAAITVNTFMDRLFLLWYSPESGAAAMPGAMMSWTLIGVPMGIAAYINTFVAQYHGSGHPERIGPAVWQGVWFSVVVSPILLLAVPLAGPIFRIFGHAPSLLHQEVIYFQILVYGGGMYVLGAALSSFYTGRGRTWTVLIVDASAVVFNCLLNLTLIFGTRGLTELASRDSVLAAFFLRVTSAFHWTIPELGIRGAAMATVAAAGLRAAIYVLLFLSSDSRRKYATGQIRFDREIAVRLLRYGTPSGLTSVVDAASFTIFLLLIGHLGIRTMQATNMAFAVNSLAFMPIAGLQIGVATLVGRWIGRRKAEIATRVTWNGQKMSFVYMGTLAIGYICFPDVFLLPFRSGMDPDEFASVSELTRMYMKFMGFYAVFDGMQMVFSGTLRGAGDTRFLFFAITIVSSVVVFACWLALRLGCGSGVCWGLLTLWMLTFTLVFGLRYRGGRWKRMRVIEV